MLRVVVADYQMAATQAIHAAREKALEDLGITVEKDVRTSPRGTVAR